MNHSLTEFFSFVLAVFRSIKYSIKDAWSLIKIGNARGAFWRVFIRNRVSLWSDTVSGRSFVSSELLAELRETSFAELSPLPTGLVASASSCYLADVSDFSTFSEHVLALTRSGIIRPEGCDLTKFPDVTNALLRHDDLTNLVSTHLDLSIEDLYFYARIDASFVIPDGKLTESDYDGAFAFHRDIDSRKFVKVFFYLNDIRVGDGHHEVMLYSHRDIPLYLRPLGRYSLSQLEAKLRKPCSLKRVTGSRGYGWIENTTAFHRATIPTSGPRLLLMLSFNDNTANTIHGSTKYRRVVDFL